MTVAVANSRDFRSLICRGSGGEVVVDWSDGQVTVERVESGAKIEKVGKTIVSVKNAGSTAEGLCALN